MGKKKQETKSDYSARYYNLFKLMNKISYLPYEGSESKGGFILADPNEIEIKVDFRKPRPKLNIENAKLARKLLELSSNAESIYLLINGKRILGLATLKDHHEGILISIAKRGVWELTYHRSSEKPLRLLRVEDGQPSLPKEKISENKFEETFQKIFNQLPVKELYKLAEAATTQRHGTILIISSDAETEAKRLEKRSTPITPLKMTTELLKRVSSIDGAILLDKDATCYAIGVILDGKTTDKQGDSSRGSRYNSALTYVNDPDIHLSIAIVVSEDGYINILFRPKS